MGFLGNIFKMHFNGIKAIVGRPKVLEVSNKEKIAFQNMMLTPNDETVSAYIEALKDIMKAINDFYGSQSIATGTQIKYVNAYSVIKKTNTVSDDLKAELGRILLAMGIAISVD